MNQHVTRRLLLGLAIVGVYRGCSTAARAEPPAARVADEHKDNIKPLPLVPIPDDPPPHEGAMINIPNVLEPPDLLLVEVLEALPGRPISGERLVRPDGTISLGFYGDVQVRGLTLPQVKEKIVRHMRTFLADEVLGLQEPVFDDDELAPLPGDPAPAKGKTKETKDNAEAAPRVKSSSAQPHAGRVRLVSQSKDNEKAPDPLKASPFELNQATGAPVPNPPTNRIEVPSGAGFKISIEIVTQPNATAVAPAAAAPAEAAPPTALEPKIVPVHPLHTDRVFVDISAWNSKNYYVQGDVADPGRLPCTGNETVLDAINYAGGLIPTADPKNIRLVRPARGGKPSRVYKVDLEAITERGESEKNYQLFPGDRLVVGRNAVVKTMLELDRVAAPLQTAFNTILQQSFAMRSLMQSTIPLTTGAASLTPAQREALAKDWVDFLWKVASNPDGAKLDEKTFREALMKALNPPK